MFKEAYCLYCGKEIISEHAKMFCNKSCSAKYYNKKRSDSGWRHSKKSKQQMREKSIANPTGWAANPEKYRGGNGPSKDKEKWTQSICKECGIEFDHYIKEIRVYCSKLCSEKNNFHINSTRKTRSFYKNQQMDSGDERKFAELLDQYDIIWVKNSKVYFEFKDKKNKIRRYYPDFYLPEYDLWIEIKSEYYFRENDKLRWAAVPNHEVIWHHDIKLPYGLSVQSGVDATLSR